MPVCWRQLSSRSAGLVLCLATSVVIESGPLRASGAWSPVVPLLDRPEAGAITPFVALLVLSLGAVATDPVAPLVLCVALGVLGLYGRVAAWRSLVVTAASYTIWLLVVGDPWWSPRSTDLSSHVRGFGLSSGLLTGGPDGAPASQVSVTRVQMLLGLAVLGPELAVSVAAVARRYCALRPAVPLLPLVPGGGTDRFARPGRPVAGAPAQRRGALSGRWGLGRRADEMSLRWSPARR